MPKNLVIRTSNWLGDCVMSVAAIREVRRAHLDWQLTVAAPAPLHHLFEGQEFVDRVLALPGGPHWKRVYRYGRSLRGFDESLLLPNSFASALEARLAGIPSRLGYATDSRSLLLTRAVPPRSPREHRHHAYYYLDLIYQLGLSTTDYFQDSDFAPDIGIRVDDQALSAAEKLLAERGIDRDRPLVAIHPGAAFGPAKRWLPERFGGVADRLISEQGAAVVLIGSSEERALSQQIAAGMRERAHRLTGETTLSDLLGLLSLCDLVIANDSGPMHLAAALQRPQIALFGSTDETVTGPLNQKARIIHKHVECSPCLLRNCPIDLRCFHRISVDEVVEASRLALAPSGQASQ